MTDRKTLDQMTSDDLDALHAELDQLRAGEEDSYDPLTEATPGQWIHQFNQATPEKRLAVVAALLRDSARGRDCWFLGHEKRLADDRHAWVAVARVRDVIADMENITGARHWARILRKAVDGEEPAPVPSVPAATQATDDDGIEPLAAYQEALRRVESSGPRPAPAEHCGHLSPQTLFTSPPTECVLPPGHQGSHADDRGCRWWPVPDAAAEDEPAPAGPDTVTDPEWLRGQYAAAIRDRFPQTPDSHLTAAVDAVLGVRDRHLDQMRQRLALADEARCDAVNEIEALHSERNTEASRATAAEQQRDRLAALVRDFLDPDPCYYDHHGYCQAHVAGLGGEPMSCPHRRAREVLAALNPQEPS